MSCQFYNNFYSEQNPHAQVVRKLQGQKAELLKLASEGRAGEEDIKEFNRINDVQKYTFCDNKFHFRSKGDSWVDVVLGRCPNYRDPGESKEIF